MKYLATLFSALFIVAATAQQMPYNPDANGDDFVGVDDVLGVLGVYDTALMQPDLQCEYEGTDLEAFYGQVFNQEIVLDSVYIEFLYSDSVETFIAGCPDPIMIETVLERSFMMTSPSTYFNQPDQIVLFSTVYLGYERALFYEFYSEGGGYRLRYLDGEGEFLSPYVAYSNWSGNIVSLPFDETWELTGDGIEVGWSQNSFLGNCELLRVIPFWHEAE